MLMGFVNFFGYLLTESTVFRAVHLQANLGDTVGFGCTGNQGDRAEYHFVTDNRVPLGAPGKALGQ